jgi:hypothetical protein
MSSRLEVRRTETSDGDDYAVEVEVVSATGMPTELLVYRGEVFDHVASLRDLLTYPPSVELARALGQEFHRASSVRLVYKSPSEAREAGEHIESRLSTTRIQYDAAQPPDFGYNAVTVYP